MFKGSGVAIITPFDDSNQVDYLKLAELIEFQISNNTDAIIVCGTTGEASTLSNIEKKAVIKFTVELVNKRVPVIAGTGSNNTQDVIEMSKYACDEAKADGLLIVTPYYNKCTQEGLYLHYKKIADSVSIPIILYNVPSRTGVNIEPTTLVLLSQIENIVAIKEASGNISQVTKMMSLVNENFLFYSGNDDQILPMLALGASGTISVAANIIPKEIHNLCYSYFNLDINNAKSIHFKYLDMINKLFIEVNPIPIKEAMNIRGFNVGGYRLPLCKINNKNYDILKEALDVLDN